MPASPPSVPDALPLRPAPGMQVLLRRFPKSHPFASLTGTENCISFTTLRYRWGLSRLYRPLACDGCGCYDEGCPRRIPLPAGVPHIPIQPLGRPPAEAFFPLSTTRPLAAPAHPTHCSNPSLIVRGPGAGPAVTAAGVFGDLIALARYLGAPS